MAINVAMDGEREAAAQAKGARCRLVGPADTPQWRQAPGPG